MVDRAPSLPAIVPKPLAVAPGRGAFELTRSSRIVAPDDDARGVARLLAERIRPATGYRLPVTAARGTSARGDIALVAPAGRQGARRRGLPPDRRAGTSHARRPHGRRPLPRHADAPPAPSCRDREGHGAARAVARPGRHDPRPAAVRVARDDARRRAPLLRRGRGRAARRPARALQAQPAPSPPDRRPGLAARDPLAAEAHPHRRAHRRGRRAGRVLHAARLPRGSSPTPPSGSSRSCRRSTCRATSTPRSPPTASSTATASRRRPYTGIEVGFSSLCIRKEATYAFVDDVLGEVAALTPGPYLHVGGDEALSTDADDYRAFVERVQRIVRAHGKRMLGWEEVGQRAAPPRDVVQHWHDPQLGARARSRRARSSCSRPRRRRTST